MRADVLGRRHFLRGGLALVGLGLVGGCGVLPPWTQPPSRVARIAWLALLQSDDSAFLLLFEAFRQGLRERGWTEGQNLTLDFRFANGRIDRLPALAEELVRAQPDVLVAGGGLPNLQALRNATKTIPIIVPSYGGDPAADGLVASLARPGGNVTGLSNNAPELAGKRLELLKEAVPGLSRVAVLWNATSPTPTTDWSAMQAAAQMLGVTLLALPVRGPEDFEAAFDAAIAEAPDGLIVLQDVITYAHRTRIIDFAVRHRLPAMSSAKEWAEDGALLAYGPNLPDLYRRAASYVDKVLRGTSPAELPIERPTTFDFAINLQTAQALGITIPQSVLQRSTEAVH